MGYYNIEKQNWKDNLLKMKYKTAVAGLPFCKETGIENEWKILEKTDNSFIIEMKSLCKDSPGCDTFYIEEIIIVLGI